VGGGGGGILLPFPIPRLRPEPLVVVPKKKRIISGRGAIRLPVALIEGTGTVTFVGQGAARRRPSAIRARGAVVLKGRAELAPRRVAQMQASGHVVLRDDDIFGLELEDLELGELV
jgi:hypothetical protein